MRTNGLLFVTLTWLTIVSGSATKRDIEHLYARGGDDSEDTRRSPTRDAEEAADPNLGNNEKDYSREDSVEQSRYPNQNSNFNSYGSGSNTLPLVPTLPGDVESQNHLNQVRTNQNNFRSYPNQFKFNHNNYPYNSEDVSELPNLPYRHTPNRFHHNSNRRPSRFSPQNHRDSKGVVPVWGLIANGQMHLFLLNSMDPKQNQVLAKELYSNLPKIKAGVKSLLRNEASEVQYTDSNASA